MQVWDITNAAADTYFDFQVVYDGVPQNLSIVSRDGAPLRETINGNLTATVINQVCMIYKTRLQSQV